MAAVPMLTVIDTPLVGSNPQTRNGRSAWGRSLGMGGRSLARQTEQTTDFLRKFSGCDVGVLSNISFKP